MNDDFIQFAVKTPLFTEPIAVRYRIVRRERIPRPGLRWWFLRILRPSDRTAYYWRLYTEDGKTIVYMPYGK